MIEIVFYSIIIGALGGACIAAGASRMFYVPKIQAMGAFRTLGEMNACNGDPVSHFSFGLGFFFSSAASAVGTGCLTSDVLHRIVPNWSAALVLSKNRNVKESLWNPAKMAYAGALVGAAVYTFMNTLASIIPERLSTVAANVLEPAASWLINPVMPGIFWLAAVDAGKNTGIWGSVFGGVSALVSGNAVPGIVLGILIGKSVDTSGYKSNATKVMILITIVMFAAIAYFRGFYGKLLNFTF